MTDQLLLIQNSIVIIDGALVITVDELIVTLMCMNDVFISDYIEYDSTAIIDGA